MRQITPIDDYSGRPVLDSDQITTTHELGLESGPIVIFDLHIGADLERIEGSVGSQDLPELVARCVNFVAKLTEDTAKGAKVQLDFAEVKRALVGEEGETRPCKNSAKHLLPTPKP